MRNRFHKEPVDPNNIIRPDQAGTKENPDYVVNIQGNCCSQCHFDFYRLQKVQPASDSEVQWLEIKILITVINHSSAIRQ